MTLPVPKSYVGHDDHTLLNLGNQPLANQLHKTKEDSLFANKYPLRAIRETDGTIHLNTAIPPEILYKDYVYNSGISAPYKEHCRKMFNTFTHLNHDTIIDIGGNDGTLLKTFKESTNKSLNLINVDASASFKEQNEEAGIKYINAFFSDALDLPKADIITSTNVFQHTKDIHSFLRGIKKCLDGVWILEFPYTLRTLQTLQFDQFYHEHYYYWMVTPLVPLFKEYGLKIIHAEEHPIHGGSIRLWMTNKTPSAPEGAAERFLKEEACFSYDSFFLDVYDKIFEDAIWIRHLKGRTAFFGAAAKGCVYLNALGLNCNTVPGGYIIDDTPSKQDLYVGGTGFQIKNREFLYEDQPDNLIVLAHNFRECIETSLRPQYRGRIITMFPDIIVND